MLLSISPKKTLGWNNIGGALLLGVEVGDGWFVCFDSLRSRRLNPRAGEHEHVRFSLYTVERWKWYGNR
jgi:hypothetical protein